MTNNSNSNEVKINKSTIQFSGTQKYFQTVEFGVKTSEYLNQKYNAYVAKMEYSNQEKINSKKDPLKIKSFNDYSATIITKVSNAIALTLNLKESEAEYSLQGLKLTGKNVSNITKMADDIESAISTGFLFRDGKKILISGFSYSIDNKIYYRFNQIAEFSAMLKRDGVPIKSIFNSGLFNTNIK